MAADIPISKLTHDITQIAYKELHALLDSMSELGSMERRERIFDYAASTRHRMIRLLVAVRWHMECSSYHLSAGSLSAVANSRSANYTTAADNLFGVRQLSLGAAGQPSAVAYAAEVLGDGGLSTFRLPRVIEAAADVDTLMEKDETLPKMRARRETRHAVRVGLPKDIAIIDLSVDPDGMAVRVGIPNVWCADVLLDSPDPAKANFRIHDFKILLRGHIDACGPTMRITPDDEPMSMMKDHFSRLCALMEDRMTWAADLVSDDGPKARAEASLHCMCMVLSREICTGLVLEHVRQQVKPLARCHAWRDYKLVLRGLGSKAGALVPVSIEYWNLSPFAAKITIGGPGDHEYTTSDFPNAKGLPHEIVRLSHAPELPPMGQEVKLDLANIDVEAVLLAAARRRAQHILALIHDNCKAECAYIARTALATHSAGAESLVIDIGQSGFSLQLSMSLRSGAFRVSLRGATNLTSQYRLSVSENLRRSIWKGEMHFKDGVKGVSRALIKIIFLQAQMLNILSIDIHTTMADELTLLIWPPGPAALECPKNDTIEKFKIRPPFIGVDRSNPRKFLAANSWLDSTDDSPVSNYEPSKRTRKSPVNFKNTSDALVFIQGKEPHGLPPRDTTDFVCRASTSARFSELRHANEMRFRRDYLLREFDIYKIGNALNSDSELRNSFRTPINLTSISQLPVNRAHLVLCGVNRWRVELELSSDCFDIEKNSTGVPVIGPHYIGGAKRLLIFTYEGNTRVIQSFMYDLRCACKMTRIARAIASHGTCTAVTERTPRQVTIRAFKLTCTILWDKYGYFFKIRFDDDSVVKHCVHFVELLDEIMESLLSDSEPNAVRHLEQTLALIPALERVCAYNWVSAPKFKLSFRVLLPVAINGKWSALELDTRFSSGGTVTITDCGRSMRSVAANGRSGGEPGNQGAVSSSGSRPRSGTANRLGAAGADSAGERSTATAMAANSARGVATASASSGRRSSGNTGIVLEPIPGWDELVTKLVERKYCKASSNKPSIVMNSKHLEQVLCLLARKRYKESSRPESSNSGSK